MTRTKTGLIFSMLAICLGLLILLGSSAAQESPQKKISALYLSIQGSISPAQADLLEKALEACKQEGHELLLLRLDTPGGLGQSMREMLQSILNSPVPVATWVGPKGARAASAGVFLVAGSTVAGMSPQTTIGAATPVQISGEDAPSAMQEKIMNDFLSLIRGVAKAKGRNVQWYQEAVEKAASITASEAAQNRVVDMLATSPEDFLEQIGAQGLELPEGTTHFTAQDVQLVEFEPGLRHGILSWLLNPQIAYFLLMGGIAGLFFELSNPGAIFPGVLGSACLLLGLYAMAILPTNVAGLLLILLSFILFILELALVSYGLLSIGGVVCLFLGSLLLFDFEYGYEGLPIRVILPTIGAVAGLIALGLYLITRSQVKPKQGGQEAMLGLPGKVVNWSGDHGQVLVRGELWQAKSPDGSPLEKGTRVQVQEMHGLILIVSPQKQGA
ncbi:MAG: nodulation protein NfeD [Desulfohalobiaceae bacterium]